MGLKHRGGPKAVEASAQLRRLPAGAAVLVYRTTTKKWEGPFTFISFDRETAVVQTGAGRRIFRSKCVKPVTRSEFDPVEDACKDPDSDEEQITPITGLIIDGGKAGDSNKQKRSKMRKTKYTAAFKESRKEELKRLLRECKFEKTSRKDLPPDTRFFGSRFIYELKRASEGLRRKSRLVAQNNQDEEAGKIATKLSTVQLYLQRVLLSLAESQNNMTLCTLYVSQAYVQRDKPLERPVYIESPHEMKLGPDVVLRVVRSLSGDQRADYTGNSRI